MSLSMNSIVMIWQAVWHLLDLSELGSCVFTAFTDVHLQF